MSVWIVKSDVDKYQYLVLSHERDATALRTLGAEPLITTWKPLSVELVTSKQSEQPVLGNFLSFAAGLACDEAAKTIIEPLIGQDAEFLPLQYDRGTFYFINVIHPIDCLDYERSEFTYWKDGGIKSVVKYAFKPTYKSKSIFKIWKGSTRTYVTDVFKALIEENGLQGLTFRKVWEE